MGLREDILRKIDKRQQELAEREVAFQIERASAAAYIQALQDTLKSLPREASEAREARHVLRQGSAMAQAKDAIEAAGRPLHISDILRAVGRPNTKQNRISVGGSISNYVRRGEIFIRTAPNTFGVMGMEAASAASPPPGFGVVRKASLVHFANEDGAPEEDQDDEPDEQDDEAEPDNDEPDWDEPF